MESQENCHLSFRSRLLVTIDHRKKNDGYLFFIIRLSVDCWKYSPIIKFKHNTNYSFSCIYFFLLITYRDIIDDKNKLHRLMKMWEIVLECHQAQLHAISQAKALDFAFTNGINQMESTKQLQVDLLSWLTSFSAWIHFQRSYVQSLNNWLKMGLNYEPEMTEDGLAPFSPGRLGLSPVFIILNNWSEIIDKKISEVNAVEAMESLYKGILELREKQKLEQHQMLTANSDQKAIRTMEREERLLLKELKAKNRKLKSTLSQNNVYFSRAETGSGSAPDTHRHSLKRNLMRIFESMEGFASDNARAYEELHMHSDEESSSVN